MLDQLSIPKVLAPLASGRRSRPRPLRSATPGLGFVAAGLLTAAPDWPTSRSLADTSDRSPGRTTTVRSVKRVGCPERPVVHPTSAVPSRRIEVVRAASRASLRLARVQVYHWGKRQTADGVPVACPIGRSTPGDSRSLPDRPKMATHLRGGRLTRCANRPSEQRAAGSDPAGRARRPSSVKELRDRTGLPASDRACPDPRRRGDG
jgi:hypothetical protein